MDKKIMLAVAGAGKTYELCHSINKEQRNFLLAYTNENIKNIYNGYFIKNWKFKVNVRYYAYFLIPFFNYFCYYKLISSFLTLNYYNY